MRTIISIILIALLVLVGCAQTTETDPPESAAVAPPVPATPSETVAPEQEALDPSQLAEPAEDWMHMQLEDAASGETFSIDDFAGKPVLMESFAVWCPTCLKQQKETAKLLESEGDAIEHVSLDTDPNEDVAVVATHVNQHGFAWHFAVAPPEFTKQLIDEFGFKVVSAPSVPIILVCPDQSKRLLSGRGVKSPDTLLEEIAKGC